MADARLETSSNHDDSRRTKADLGRGRLLAWLPPTSPWAPREYLLVGNARSKCALVDSAADQLRKVVDRSDHEGR